MTALLNLAAIHWANFGFMHSTKELTILQCAALKQLGFELSQPTNEATLAAALLLCYAEVISGKEGNSSWRLHLEGAATLLGAWSGHLASHSNSFIARCFVLLAALANISRLPPSRTVREQALQMSGYGLLTSHIDNSLSYPYPFSVY